MLSRVEILFFLFFLLSGKFPNIFCLNCNFVEFISTFIHKSLHFSSIEIFVHGKVRKFVCRKLMYVIQMEFNYPRNKRHRFITIIREKNQPKIDDSNKKFFMCKIFWFLESILEYILF